jgi:ABC-type branched-subunit amino acid transport system ATPase component
MALHMVDLRKRFGGLVALDGCTFSCAAATVTGLVGPNGSGKSTLFNAVTGVMPADSGDIRLGDVVLSGRKPHEVARLGVGRTFQTTRLFKSLTVLENVLLGTTTGESTRQANDDAGVLLERFGVAPLAARTGDVLSFGQQRLVELARAMMGKPKFMLLDEPFAGLSPAMADDIARHVAALPAAGIGVVLIEHDLAMVARLCPRVVVLHRGRVIADGTPAAVRSDAQVIGSYLGQAA